VLVDPSRLDFCVVFRGGDDSGSASQPMGALNFFLRTTQISSSAGIISVIV
jgi:hypothetical protein